MIQRLLDIPVQETLSAAAHNTITAMDKIDELFGEIADAHRETDETLQSRIDELSQRAPNTGA